jgi:hypothetical protein
MAEVARRQMRWPQWLTVRPQLLDKCIQTQSQRQIIMQ